MQSLVDRDGRDNWDGRVTEMTGVKDGRGEIWQG